MRNKVFAHRQKAEVVVPEKTATSAQIECFMVDMTLLIGLLCGIAHATAYDPKDTAQVYDHYARFFWTPVRGERTEGHPNFRPPLA